MILYFDEQGTLKEIIEETVFRQGDSKRNKLYIFVEGTYDNKSCWVKYKKPNGEYTNEVQFNNFPVFVELPKQPKRNLKYFSYNHTQNYFGETKVGYVCYEVTIPDEVLSSSLDDEEELPSQNNLVIARIRFVKNDDSIFTLGAVVFSVQSTLGIVTDSSINETQYNYLIQDISKKIATVQVKASQTMQTSTLPSIVVPKLSVSQLEEINEEIANGSIVAIKYNDNYFFVNEVEGSTNGVRVIYYQTYLDYYVEGDNVVCEYVDLGGGDSGVKLYLHRIVYYKDDGGWMGLDFITTSIDSLITSNVIVKTRNAEKIREIVNNSVYLSCNESRSATGVWHSKIISCYVLPTDYSLNFVTTGKNQGSSSLSTSSPSCNTCEETLIEEI